MRDFQVGTFVVFVLVPLQQISAKFFGVTEKKRIFSIYREYKI
jgi:hypothetical protein